MFKREFFLALSVCLVFVLGNSAAAGTFIPVELPACPTNGLNIFTTNINGAQFPQPGWGGEDGCKFAVRWQGEDAVASYYTGDLSRYTGFDFKEAQKPPPLRQQKLHQRGPILKSEYQSSGVQFYDDSGGIYLSTWAIPSQIVIGGGFNNWFVKSPKKEERAPAFYFLDSNGEKKSNDLAIQAEIAVTFLDVHHVNLETRKPGAQVAFIISLKDRTHPWLHEVVLVAATHDSFSGNSGPSPDGFVGCDFGPQIDPAGKGGVWFTGTRITPENVDPYSEVVYTRGYTQQLMPMDNRDAKADFFRLHYTAEKFKAFLSKVNSMEVGGLCPKNGYSTNPDDYDISNAGLIVESVTFDEKNDGSVGDEKRNQVAIAARFTAPKLYRYVP